MCCCEPREHHHHGHHGHHHHHRHHGSPGCTCHSEREHPAGCECGCRCGPRHDVQECGCRDGGQGGFHRRFRSKAEVIAELESYLTELKAEAQAVEERLNELRA